MKLYFRKLGFISTWVAIVTVGVQSNVWAGNNQFERIFIFGDSLSDPGNVYALLRATLPPPYTSQPPYEVIPSKPYDIDGFQFSDGKTWAQWFARHLEMKKSGQAALNDPGVNGNYAFGGARLRSLDPNDPTSATSQLNRFLGDYGGLVDPQALYVIQFGGNDVRDALGILLLTGDIEAAGNVVKSAVETEVGMIFQLYQLGARHFLVANVPNISVTPAVKMFGSQGILGANLLVGEYNNGLGGGLQSLQGLHGISINQLDLHAIVTAIVDDPKSFGIGNTEAPCLMFMIETGAICSKSNKYLFWDGIHPTARVHKIVSEHAARIYD